MLQLEEKVDYMVYFYEHQQGETLILVKAIGITVKGKKILGWIMTSEKQLVKLNLGNKEECKEVLVNAILLSVFQTHI
jgi:hypothetical protein